MKQVVIVAAKRTPISSFLGSLAGVSAPQLGAVAIKALLAETGVAPEAVDEVIMGNVLTTGVEPKPGAPSGAGDGIPIEKPATTVNVVCGSGMKAVQMAAQAIMCGDAEIVVAGGQESMSPAFMQPMRSGLKMGDGKLADSMVSDGLTDAYHHYHMGITAENIVEKLGISREAQDAFGACFAAKSHRRARREAV